MLPMRGGMADGGADSLAGTADAEGVGQAVAVAGEAEPVDPNETPQERLSRALYAEGRMIGRRLLPGLGEKGLGQMIGWGIKTIGQGPAVMVQVLRDVERDLAFGRIHGDVEQAIRGYVHNRGGTSKAQREAPTAGDRIRQLEELARARGTSTGGRYG